MPYKTQIITKTDDDLVFRRIHICLRNEQSCWCPFGVICSTCTCGVIENVTFEIRARAARYVTDHQGIPAQKKDRQIHLSNPTMRQSNISQQCIRQISHNAPFCNRNVHMCAHFCYKWCIAGYLSNALWDLWDGVSMGVMTSQIMCNSDNGWIPLTVSAMQATLPCFIMVCMNIEHLLSSNDNQDNDTYPQKWLINQLGVLRRHIWRIILTAGVLLHSMIFTGVFVYTLGIPARVCFKCYTQKFVEVNPPQKVIIKMYHHSCSVKVTYILRIYVYGGR